MEKRRLHAHVQQSTPSTRELPRNLHPTRSDTPPRRSIHLAMGFNSTSIRKCASCTHLNVSYADTAAMKNHSKAKHPALNGFLAIETPYFILLCMSSTLLSSRTNGIFAHMQTAMQHHDPLHRRTMRVHGRTHARGCEYHALHYHSCVL